MTYYNNRLQIDIPSGMSRSVENTPPVFVSLRDASNKCRYWSWTHPYWMRKQGLQASSTERYIPQGCQYPIARKYICTNKQKEMTYYNNRLQIDIPSGMSRSVENATPVFVSLRDASNKCRYWAWTHPYWMRRQGLQASSTERYIPQGCQYPIAREYVCTNKQKEMMYNNKQLHIDIPSGMSRSVENTPPLRVSAKQTTE